MARAWHFFFAWVLLVNGLAYVAYSAASRHLARDLAPDRSDWRSIGRSIVDHLRFRHPAGEAAKRYNVLQKLAYLVVIFVPAAARHPDGHRDVAVDELGAARLGRLLRRPAVGAHDPFHRRLAARRVRADPRVRGRRLRALEPPALDDHRPLPDPDGGRHEQRCTTPAGASWRARWRAAGTTARRRLRAAVAIASGFRGCWASASRSAPRLRTR